MSAYDKSMLEFYQSILDKLEEIRVLLASIDKKTKA